MYVTVIEKNIPVDELEEHPDLVIKFQLAADSDSLERKWK